MKSKIIFPKRNNKMHNPSRFGISQIRMWQTKERKLKKGGVVSPSVLLKCGCCDKKVQIFYGGGTIEINGVIGSVDDWSEILLPMLDKNLNKDDDLQTVVKNLKKAKESKKVE
jgi:hypothetical protein